MFSRRLLLRIMVQLFFNTLRYNTCQYTYSLTCKYDHIILFILLCFKSLFLFTWYHIDFQKCGFYIPAWRLYPGPIWNDSLFFCTNPLTCFILGTVCVACPVLQRCLNQTRFIFILSSQRTSYHYKVPKWQQLLYGHIMLNNNDTYS